MSGNTIQPTNSYTRFDPREIEQSIPSRFAQMVKRYPDRLAVGIGEHTQTYAALDRASDALARAILHRGTPDGAPVALAFDQSAPAIAAILGVLKAGRCYVFLDPSLPSERIDFILKDSGARMVLSDAANFTRAGSHPGLHAIDVDACPDTPPGSNAFPAVAPDAAACIVYTSGSTGIPKGVVQSHRSLLAGTMNYTNAFHVSSHDRLCFFYYPGVIAAVRMMWLALCNGAALCIRDLKGEGIANLAVWLRRERITLYTSVASVFRQFTNLLTAADRFPDLRLIRLGGEPALPMDVAAYKKHFSNECLLVNRIGSTETGTYCWYAIDKRTSIEGHTVPVGFPMDGYEVSLLDENGEEVGGDGIGEIVVKSAYLPPGYWNRPDLMETSFLPVSVDSDVRMYRSGDLGRRLPDGCLMHMGRKDYQVKIRGHRIELAEIEAALRELDMVKEAVVMPRKGQEGEQHLVAYFVPAEGHATSISALRRELALRLPDFRIPQYFVPLSEFPRAAGGKINRGALPSPERVRPALDVPFVAPRNAIEAKLAQLWSEVLGLDEIGVQDPFLDLGGDSLRAMQLLSRIGQHFDAEPSVRALLDSPTIAVMAERLAHLTSPDSPALAIDVERAVFAHPHPEIHSGIGRDAAEKISGGR